MPPTQSCLLVSPTTRLHKHTITLPPPSRTGWTSSQQETFLSLHLPTPTFFSTRKHWCHLSWQILSLILLRSEISLFLDSLTFLFQQSIISFMSLASPIKWWRRAMEIHEANIFLFTCELNSLHLLPSQLLFLDEASIDSHGMLEKKGWFQRGRRLVYRQCFFDLKFFFLL